MFGLDMKSLLVGGLIVVAVIKWGGSVPGLSAVKSAIS